MPTRYIASSRTRSGTSSSLAQLQDQFIRELTDQANAVLNQFSDDLQAQSAQLLGSILGDGSDASSSGISQLLSTSARLLDPPTTTQTTTETALSQAAQTQFRLSQSQTLAEANLTIAKGDKNL